MNRFTITLLISLSQVQILAGAPLLSPVNSPVPAQNGPELAQFITASGRPDVVPALSRTIPPAPVAVSDDVSGIHDNDVSGLVAVILLGIAGTVALWRGKLPLPAPGDHDSFSA